MQTVACGYGVCGLDLGAPQLVDGGAGVVRTRAQEITAVYVGDRSSSRDEAVLVSRLEADSDAASSSSREDGGDAPAPLARPPSWEHIATRFFGHGFSGAADAPS